MSEEITERSGRGASNMAGGRVEMISVRELGQYGPVIDIAVAPANTSTRMDQAEVTC